MIWNASKTATADMALLQFNADTGANYNDQRLAGAAAVASAARVTGGTSIQIGNVPTGANLFGGGMVVIPHYANTANHKAVLAMGGEVENRVDAIAGRWANTGAITSIVILTTSSTFVANSIFLLCAVDERYLVEESSLSADGTVTFSAIPQTPGDLVVVGFCRTDAAAAGDAVNIAVNADVTDANYAFQHLDGAAATTSASTVANRYMDRLPGNSATANAFGAFILSVSQHANGVKQPHMLAVSGFHETGTPSGGIAVASGRRANIAAVTSLAFTPDAGTNFKSGSLFSLYHVPKRLVAYKKLTADAASITHTVPAGYEALVETVFARSDRVNARDSVLVAFNNDTTDANYDLQELDGDGAVVAASQSTGNRSFSNIPAASAAANVFGGGSVLIPAYGEADRHKHFLGLEGPVDDMVLIFSNRWESTAAITEIDLTLSNGPNFEGN